MGDVKAWAGRNIRAGRKAQGCSPLQEALIELIEMCRGHPNENIALIVEVARPILQRLRTHGKPA